MAAVLAVSLSSNNGQPIIEKTPALFRVFGRVTLAGVYAAGGMTFDLTTLFALATSAPGKSLPGGALPAFVRFWSAKPSSAPQTNLFVYNYVPGTTLANGLIQVFTGAAAQTALTELANGAFPAGVTADVINFEIGFPVP